MENMIKNKNHHLKLPSSCESLMVGMKSNFGCKRSCCLVGGLQLAITEKYLFGMTIYHIDDCRAVNFVYFLASDTAVS